LSLLAVLAAPVVASEPAAPPAAARSSDEIVCKKFAENGTLIRKRKVCMTRAEWRRLSEDAQHHTAKLAADNVGGNIGCTGGKPGC
jgi:hypothetical protein